MPRNRNSQHTLCAILAICLTLIGNSPRSSADESTQQNQTAAASATTNSVELPKPELVVQSGHTSPVNVLSFSPDGKLLASGSGTDLFQLEVNVVKLWDVATGSDLRTLAHEAPVKWIGFSTDGRRVAAKGGVDEDLDKVRVWDVKTGAVIPDATIDSDYVSLPASADGQIAADIDTNDIKLRDVATGKHLRTLARHTSDFQKVKFSPDSTILGSGGTQHSIRLWDLRSGVLRTLVGHTEYPICADYSPDSRLFASGGRDKTVRIWDVASGRELHKLEGHESAVTEITFSPNGKTLISNSDWSQKLWDVATGREIKPGDGKFTPKSYDKTGNILVAEHMSDTLLWDIAAGKELHRVPSCRYYYCHFSPDGRLMTTEANEQIQLFELPSCKQLAAIETTVPSVDSNVRHIECEFSPDSRTLAVTEMDYRKKDHPAWRLKLFEAATAKPLHTIQVDDMPSRDARDLVFTADSKQIMNIAETVTIWDVATGEKVRSFAGSDKVRDNLRDLWPLAPHYLPGRFGDYSPLSPNGAYYAHIGENGEIHLLEAQNWGWLATLIGIHDKDWLVYTQEGFFDGSPEAWKYIIWRFNNDTFNYAPLEAFFNEFYYPGLLSDVLAGKWPQAPAGKDLSQIDRRQPKVSVTQLTAAENENPGSATKHRKIRIAVDIDESVETPAFTSHPTASGAQDVRLFRNGSLVKAWRGDAFPPGSSGDAEQPRHARYEVDVPIVAGANEFKAYAFNNANVKSADATLSITGAKELHRDPTLFVLAVGVNEYDYQPLNLKYAVADAKAFADEIPRHQRSLGQFAQHETQLRINQQATKENILDVLTEMAGRAQPEDTVVVYFAGHGTAQGNQFYLIPHDIGYADDSPKDENDGLPQLLRRCISDRELEQAFEQIDASQVLLVIDACNSGQALESEEKRRGPMNSKGLAQLAHEKGMFVLTAAQSFQAAQEVSKLGHGLLTYVLLEEGLKMTAADSSQDGRIDMREWVEYATRRVPEIQIQEMQLASARGSNLAFAEDELALDLSSRSGQRPRMFYRADLDASPVIMANADKALAAALDDLDSVTAHSGETKRAPVVVAIADRTIMDELLPAKLKDRWRQQARSLNGNDDESSLKVSQDPQTADWLLQVAALERPDVVFLVPAIANDEVKNKLTTMSPAGDAALPWLQTELIRLSRLGPIDPARLATTEDRGLGIFRKGPAEDLNADIVEEQSGIYHTVNRTQAVLGGYGKMIKGNRLMRRLPKFEHRGLVQQLDSVRRFATVQRQGRSAGKDFVLLAGARQAWQFVTFGAEVSGSRENEVTYEIVGVRLDQTDVIKALNADSDSLTYFDYLSSQKESPCVVIENLEFTNYAASQGTTLAVEANARTTLTTDSARGRMENERSSSTKFASPVIRCYQMYEVKLHQNQVVELVAFDP